jgi:hypothetical protein
LIERHDLAHARLSNVTSPCQFDRVRHFTSTEHFVEADRECHQLREACQQDPNPQAVNVVTLGMAIVHRKRLGKPIAELRQLMNEYMPTGEEPVSFRINDFRPGPGNELKKMLAWFARPSDSCKCETRADTMNDWGPEGCRQNLDTIVEWLLEEAELRGLPSGKFTRIIAKSLVITAIRRFERKFPDGAPEPNDDDTDDTDIEQDR